MKVGEVQDLQTLTSGLARLDGGGLGLSEPASQVERRNGRKGAKSSNKVLTEHLNMHVNADVMPREAF